MISAPTLLCDYLLSKSSLTALTGTRIWAERNAPPRGYKPSHGGAICFRTRDERPEYGRAHLHNSWQFKCYGADELAANAVYLALMGVLDDGNVTAWPGLVAGLAEHKAGTFREAQTGWDYVLCYFETWMVAEL